MTTIPSPCRALALVASVCLATVLLAPAVFGEDASSGEDARPPAAVDAALAQAKSLRAGGRAEEALALLRALPREGSRRTEILFQTGLAAMAAAEAPGQSDDGREAVLDEAVAALRAILVDRPGLVRVRLELARAFFLKGEDGLAREHFERVLASAPPPAVAVNIGRYLSVMRARRRWSGYFGFALAPDSNVNGASKRDIIYFDPGFGRRLPFRLDDASQARSGVGLSVWGGGAYEHPLTPRLRLRAGADVAHREYEGRRFDQSWLGLHLGPRWLVDADTEVSVLAEASRQWVARKADRDAFGARIEAEHRLTRRLRLHATAALRERDYRRSDVLDGPAGTLSFGAALAATPTLQLRAALGVERERPEAKAWRNTDLWGRLDASLALPKGFTVGVGGELRRTGYDGGGWEEPHYTEDGEKRTDRLRILRASVHNRAFTVIGFSPELALIREVSTTNAQTRDYRRLRTELRFVRQF